MNAPGKMPASERWIRALLHLYPRDFREEMGASIVETYRDRCRSAGARGGRIAIAGVWLAALGDSLRNGLAERLRPSVMWRRSGNWGRDMEIAARRLARAPVFALATVATLTVGLGAFAVVYTVVEKVLVSPLPYDRPDDLYYVWRDYRAIFDLDRGWLGGPDIAMLDTAGGPIAGAAGIRRDRRTLASMNATEGDPEEIPVMAVTPNLFSLLGVRPMLGRGFAPDEVGPNRPAVVVLGHDLWQRRFGGDRKVIGTDVRLNGSPFRVIGVMGPDFHFVRHASLGSPESGDAYITFAYALGEMNPNNGSFAGIVRARPGASPPQIAAAVSAVGKALDEKSFGAKGLKLWPIGMKQDLVEPMRPALLVLALSGAFLVLVLAVNLATLLLARAMQREREFAVSRALGANGGALVRATLFEAGLLGALGGATATLVAIWGTRALVAIAPLDLPRRESIGVDWSVAATIVAIGALLGLAAGIAPAAWASRSSLGALLRNSAVRGGGGRGRLRRALVVVQVALCLVLLSAGGLVGRSFERLLRSQPGFDPRGVLTVRVAISQWRFPTNESAVAFHERLERELKALPGVTAVGAASAMPLTASADQTTVGLPGAPGNTGVREHDRPLVDVISARAGWPTALGIRLLAGRDFEPPRPGAAREAMIDRTLMRQFYPDGGAVGKLLSANGDTLRIVGVVDHARQYDLHRDGRPQLYVRDQDDTYGTLYFALRTRRDPEDLIPDVRAVVRRLDPQLALSEMRSLDAVVDESVRQQRTSALLVGGFSLGALLLAAVGLFGVVAGSVTSRRQEIAVRLALGAEHGRAVRLLVREGAVLVTLGIVIGVPGVWLVGRMLSGVLIGISPSDPATLIAVAAGLAAVALAACWIPARRATSIDPANVLREQ